ncbi:CHAT domain-containing tetratricopeptide repeat protein [Roseateles sp. LYH14W]|uniref:CHAT domain-containing protein n=1 Tax=Pelomonas parva TaxID=3299032 RepID=A0ABW7F6E6_9BURK
MPADSLRVPDLRQQRVALDSADEEITLDFACRGWVAQARQAGGQAGNTLDWQALVAQVLVGAQRRTEAMALAEQAYTQAQALGETGRLALRRAATALLQAHLQVRDQTASQLWAQRAVDASPDDKPLDKDGALALANRATTELMAGRFAPAAEQLNQMLQRVQAQDGGQVFRYPVAVALNQLVYAQAVQGRWTEALATADQLVAHRRQYLPADRTGLAVALGNRASALTNLSRFDEALAAMRQAIAESEGGGSSDAQASGALAQMRGNLSNLLLARGQPQDALVHAQAAAAQTQGGAKLNALHQTASAQIALGDLAGAMTTWREAQRIVDIEPPQGEAWLRLRVLLGQAQALLTLGDLNAARVLLERAEIEAARAPANLAERGQRLLVLAMWQELAGQTEAALRTLDEADSAYAVQFPPEHANRRDLLVRACGLGRGCAELPRRLGAITQQPRLAAAAALVLARDRLAAGDAESAQLQAGQAIQAAWAAASPLLQWQALAVYARSQQVHKRSAEAIFFGKLALVQLQVTRNRLDGLGPDADKLYLADKLGLYRDVAGWLLDAGRVPEGLEVLRLLKRSEQDDFNEHRSAAAAEGLSLTPRELAWRQRLDAAAGAGELRAQEIQRLNRLLAARRISREESARLQALLAEQGAEALAVRERLQSALAQVQTQTPEPGLSSTSRASADTADPRLPVPADARTLHVYLLTGADGLRAVLVGQQGRRVVRGPATAAELSRGVAGLLDAVRQRQDVRGPAQRLHAQIGALFVEQARAWRIRRLVIWSDGALRYLPLGLLHDGQSYLIERFALSMATPVDRAAAAATLAPAGKAVPPLAVQAWGVTEALAGLPALPGVGDELCGIVDGPVRGWDDRACRGVLRGQGDLNARFTETAWRAAGSTRSAGGVVHIGTHFVLRPGNVAQSWLLLGDGSRLTLEKLRQWPLGAPRLLTLSACETAVPGGMGADGREVDGLSSTLLVSGAGQVLASLWRVDDSSTASLMHRFYEQAKRRPQDLSVALQATQLEALRRGQLVQSWAAFVLSEPAAR